AEVLRVPVTAGIREGKDGEAPQPGVPTPGFPRRDRGGRGRERRAAQPHRAAARQERAAGGGIPLAANRAKARRELPRVFVAAFGRLRQAAAQDFGERRRRAIAEDFRDAWILVKQRLDRRLGRGPAERRPPREDFPEGHAERELVGGRSRGPSA